VTGASVLLLLVVDPLLPRQREHLYVMSPTYLGNHRLHRRFFGRAREQFEARVRRSKRAGARHNRPFAPRRARASRWPPGAELRLEAVASCWPGADRRTHAKSSPAAGLRHAEYDTCVPTFTPLRGRRSRRRGGSTRPQEPLFHVRAEFTAGGSLAEQVLQIMLEGCATRCATAQPARRASKLEGSGDDSRSPPGRRRRLPPLARPPWSIASRVDDLGGSLKIERGRDDGARVDVELPGGRS